MSRLRIPPPDQITAYSADTPNGFKMVHMLEEIRRPYRLVHLKLGSNQFSSPEFVRLSPAQKIPVLTFKSANATEEVHLFESAAILIFLSEQFSILRGQSEPGRAATLSWLMFQAASVGPSMGAARYFTSRIIPNRRATKKHRSDALRAISSIEARLSNVEWLNGEAFSIADIAHYGWLSRMEYAGFLISDFPSIQHWASNIADRPSTIAAKLRLAEGALGLKNHHG